jgi:hypothetical protein
MMEQAYELALTRGLRQGLASSHQPLIPEKAGCKGPACPIFDACRGRCQPRRAALPAEAST